MTDTVKIASCARCKKMFLKSILSVCDDCAPEEEADFGRISDILVGNPDENPESLAKLAGVSTACVLRMLDQNRISNDKLASLTLCGQCGAPAISAKKKLCQQCLIKLDQKFFSEISEAKRVLRTQDSKQTVHETIDAKRKSVIKSKQD